MLRKRFCCSFAIAALCAQVCVADCLKKPDGKAHKPRIEPITVPTRLLMAHALTKTTPIYPQEAIDAKIDGTVIIALEIDHDGNVTETRPLSGAARLQASAESALRQWRFESFCMHGVPYTVRSAVEFQFRWRGDGSRPSKP